MNRNKITVVGAGNVGATTAQRVVEKEIGDVVLVDIVADMPQGKCLDMTQAAPVCGYNGVVAGTNGYDAASGSDVVVITSGLPRKPGMSRDDLLKVNAGIVKDVVENVALSSPDAVIIMVSNPLDAMAYVAYKVSKFPKQRVIGMAGSLDAARMAAFIADELDVSIENVQASVLGGHGDTMVPLKRYTTVAGVPVQKLISEERLNSIVQRTRDGGAEIVKLLKTGSAFYAPSAAVADMVESIIKDKHKVTPCAAMCDGEYGIDGLFVGVPVVLGSGGIERIMEIELDADESAALNRSVEAVRELCVKIDGMFTIDG